MSNQLVVKLMRLPNAALKAVRLVLKLLAEIIFSPRGIDGDSKFDE